MRIAANIVATLFLLLALGALVMAFFAPVEIVEATVETARAAVGEDPYGRSAIGKGADAAFIAFLFFGTLAAASFAGGRRLR